MQFNGGVISLVCTNVPMNVYVLHNLYVYVYALVCIDVRIYVHTFICQCSRALFVCFCVRSVCSSIRVSVCTGMCICISYMCKGRLYYIHQRQVFQYGTTFLYQSRRIILDDDICSKESKLFQNCKRNCKLFYSFSTVASRDSFLFCYACN